jgi:RNA polymerase sigma factor (TIGR02999 family)
MSQPARPPAAGADELFAVVYADLRRMAAGHLAGERPGQTLQPTALVHEVYLRLLAGDGPPAWRDRRHFYAAAAEAMRRILIEAARRKGRDKRGGGWGRLPVDPDRLAAPAVSDDLLALDEALTAFAADEPGIAELVKLRYFGGLTLKEAAETLGLPLRTANGHWAYARAWLADRLSAGEVPESPPDDA